MKKLLAFIFVAMAITMTAVNFDTKFNDYIKENNLQSADSVLKIWSMTAPDDPELFPARFNMFLNKACNDMLVLATEPAQTDYELMLADSTGNAAGYLRGERVWDDSLVNEAFKEIDCGIAALPDRIDFRLGKAAAATMSKHWNVAVETLDALLDRDKENGGRWLTTGNAIDADADALLGEALFERIKDIYLSDSREVIESSLPLVDKAAQRFGNDIKIINMAGAINFGIGNSEAAMKYFLEAQKLTPDDGIPVTNIAYIYYQQGDTAKALEIYRDIEKGNYGEESRELASNMIKEITRPVEEMEQYDYFFRYLPGIATQIENPSEFMDVTKINSLIPSYNKFHSPFADTDIKAEEITVNDKETPVVVWTFPMPTEVPMCLYVAFVNNGKGSCRIFMLEKSIMVDWMLGTMTDSGHANFGELEQPKDAAGFVGVLKKKKLL